MDTHTTPPALEEPTLNELEDETDNDCSPQEEDTTEDNEDGIPHAQEFVELAYKDFSFKMGSCVYNSGQLGDMAFKMFNLITKPEVKNEPNNSTSYLQ